MNMAVLTVVSATLIMGRVQCAAPESVTIEPERRQTQSPPPARTQGPGVQSRTTPPPAVPPTGAAPGASPAVASSVASSVPPVIIDCATSARSAQALAELKIPYYPWFGQSADPESATTGKINIEVLLEQISKRMGPNPTGWGMLDFEEPFDAWLDLPTNDPKNRAASAELVRALQIVKRTFPKVRWTYYGMPRLARNLPDAKGELKVWELCPESSKRAEIERRIATYGDIVRELDWINPSLYDVYENSLFQGAARDAMRANENTWREQVTRLGRTTRERLGLPQVPVIPCIGLFFQSGGLATNMRPISKEELFADQVDPGLKGGADGFAIWTSMDFFQTLATMAPNPTLNQMNQENQKAARDAWTTAFFGGSRPSNWTAPEVRLVISQATGNIIAEGAKLVQDRVNQHRLAPRETEVAPTGSR